MHKCLNCFFYGVSFRQTERVRENKNYDVNLHIYDRKQFIDFLWKLCRKFHVEIKNEERIIFIYV